MFGAVVGACGDAIDGITDSGYFQGQGSQRKRVKRRVPRVSPGGKGLQNSKARWDGAFKKWMDENGDGEGTELRDRLGEIWVLRAKDQHREEKISWGHVLLSQCPVLKAFLELRSSGTSSQADLGNR
jgi:hypothetical protein